MIAPLNQERPPRWKNHPAEEWVCNTMFPDSSTSSLAHALALSANTNVCPLVPLFLSTSAPTLLLLPGALDSDRPLGLIVVTLT